MKWCENCNRQVGSSEDGCPECGQDVTSIETKPTRSHANSDYEDGVTSSKAPATTSFYRRTREIED